MHAPLAAIQLVEQGITHALQDPDFVRAVRALETALHEAAEWGDADASADEEHRAVGDEFARERVGH
ncbi:hypothetical protein V491_05361 [Pseudogymnoascus sp. VKM F-3775]|nr:hypothetical protein V491_05361 [Pseudogymnoascus sp. VKM F-3775]